MPNYTQKSDTTLLYTYKLRNRPAMYGTVPDGRQVEMDVHNLPTESDSSWGTVTYARALTPEEIYKYELLPVYPVPELPLYPVGTYVKDLGGGEISVVEYWYGDYWINDWRVIEVKDWLYFAPVELIVPLPPEPTKESEVNNEPLI